MTSCDGVQSQNVIKQLVFTEHIPGTQRSFEVKRLWPMRERTDVEPVCVKRFFTDETRSDTTLITSKIKTEAAVNQTPMAESNDSLSFFVYFCSRPSSPPRLFMSFFSESLHRSRVQRPSQPDKQTSINTAGRRMCSC